MSDESPTAPPIRDLAAEIVAAFVRRNQITSDQMPDLISSVYQALVALGKPNTDIEGPRIPAVPIRQSARRNHVICLDCGWQGQMLRRHVSVAHGLSVQEYRMRWKLPSDHPVTAAAYRERRSQMAKQIGLGRGKTSNGTAAALEPAAEEPAPPKRRGRPRSATPPA